MPSRFFVQSLINQSNTSLSDLHSIKPKRNRIVWRKRLKHTIQILLLLFSSNFINTLLFRYLTIFLIYTQTHIHAGHTYTRNALTLTHPYMVGIEMSQHAFLSYWKWFNIYLVFWSGSKTNKHTNKRKTWNLMSKIWMRTRNLTQNCIGKKSNQNEKKKKKKQQKKKKSSQSKAATTTTTTTTRIASSVQM